MENFNTSGDYFHCWFTK